MKHTAALFLGFVLLVLTSCGESKEDKLMKIWKLDDKKAEILFQFGENGAFSLQSQNFDGTLSTNTGSWKFAEGKEVLLIELNEQEKAFKIEKLTEDKMVLLPAGEKMKMTFSVKKL